MKILGFDIGDVWTGIAISDTLGITCKPLRTVKTDNLHQFLKEFMQTESISHAIVGLPLTLQGKESYQTKKVRQYFNKLEKKFSSITWETWDERLSSKRAQQKGHPTPEEKKREHARAAAFILQSYLDHQALFSPKPS